MLSTRTFGARCASLGRLRRWWFVIITMSKNPQISQVLCYTLSRDAPLTSCTLNTLLILSFPPHLLLHHAENRKLLTLPVSSRTLPPSRLPLICRFQKYFFLMFVYKRSNRQCLRALQIRRLGAESLRRAELALVRRTPHLLRALASHRLP